MVAACVALVMAVGTVGISLKHSSFITVTHWFRCFVTGRESKLFIAANASGLHDENKWSGLYA